MREGDARGILKHRKYLQAVEGRELLEVAEALHEEGLTEKDVKFLRKQIGELACQTVEEPGQARLVERQFGVLVPLQELEEIIERTRQRDHPQRKRRLKLLLTLKGLIEPCACEIQRKEGEMLRPHGALRRQTEGRREGAMDRLSARGVSGRRFR